MRQRYLSGETTSGVGDDTVGVGVVARAAGETKVFVR